MNIKINSPDVSVSINIKKQDISTAIEAYLYVC